MLNVKAREAADTIFNVFGMTQLRIKSSLPRFTITLFLKRCLFTSNGQNKRYTTNLAILCLWKQLQGDPSMYCTCMQKRIM